MQRTEPVEAKKMQQLPDAVDGLEDPVRLGLEASRVEAEHEDVEEAWPNLAGLQPAILGLRVKMNR